MSRFSHHTIRCCLSPHFSRCNLHQYHHNQQQKHRCFLDLFAETLTTITFSRAYTNTTLCTCPFGANLSTLSSENKRVQIAYLYYLLQSLSLVKESLCYLLHSCYNHIAKVQFVLLVEKKRKEKKRKEKENRKEKERKRRKERKKEKRRVKLMLFTLIISIVCYCPVTTFVSRLASLARVSLGPARYYL